MVQPVVSKAREQSNEQGKGVQAKKQTTAVISSKLNNEGNTNKDRVGKSEAGKAESSAKPASNKVSSTVTRKDILEFSGATMSEELQQSGQTSSINIVTISARGEEGFGSISEHNMNQSDSGSLNGAR